MIDVRALLYEIATLQIFIVLGALVIIGARKRWSFLVDPPESWWWFYSQSLLKKLFGTRGIVLLCYIAGAVGIIVTSVQIVQRLIVLGKALGYWS